MVIWKVITGAILGLLLQLSQIAYGIPPCLDQAASCAAATCHCCDAKNPCPCAKSADHKQAPAPAAPESKVVKLDPILPVSHHLQAFTSEIPPPASSAPASLPDHGFRGFPGVELNVSYCRFVI